ncbi:MAG: T9SS type A sorting domain-containing protein [Flavobacteriales bacterium]|nr:T9SS type A sorting domain-containing protein [Flavobacteriales bacterium]
MTLRNRIIAIQLIMIFGFTFTGIKLNAQTIQLGSGTGEQWEYSSGPINIYYRRTVCQFVYTASELSAAGASTISPITDMGLFVTNSPVYNIPNYTVKLKHTSAVDVSSALGSGGWTTVKNAFNYSPTAGNWDMLGLDNQTFVWDGVSSIGVEICWSRVTPTWNASGQIRIYAETNGYRYRWTDANGSSCGSTPTVTSSNKPQMQFVFVPGSSTTWNGSVGTDWFNPSNWSAGIPSQLMDAIIPSAPVNQPSILGQATTKSITIDVGAMLTLVGDDTLNIYENWNLNGSFYCNTGTLIVRGSGALANSMNGINNQLLYNLEVRSDAGLVLSSGSYKIKGCLRLRGGDFTSNNRVTLLSDASGTARLTTIGNLCSYSLVMSDSYGDGWNGGTVTVNFDGEKYGTFNAEGTGSTVTINIPNGTSYELVYSAGLYEGENTYDFDDPLGTTLFSDGPNPARGQVYTGTATCTFVSPFGGELRLQRYLSLGTDGWREMSTGLMGETLSDWNDDGLIMSGFTGSDYPSFSFVNAYTYAENLANGNKDNGWVAAANITDAVNPVAGHRIYIGAGTWTTAMPGPPVSGNQLFTLDYQNDPGAPDQEGWNLIGNPYPCSIDWDSIGIGGKVGIDDAIWVWNNTAGNYGVYSGGAGGIGTNGVNADIPSSQAFWVHAITTGPSLTITEGDKTEADPSFIKSTGNIERVCIRLSGDANSLYDEAVMVWKNGAADEIDEFDGFKLFSSESMAPSLSFIPEGTTHVSINVLNANSNHVSMPVEVLVGETGNYKLEFNETELLTSYSCLILEDLYTDSLIDILANPSYSFFMSAMYSGTRFMLHSGMWYSGTKLERCEFVPEIEQNHLSTSIEEIGPDMLTIYPNPCKEKIHIQWTNSTMFKIDQIEVLSITGEVVQTYQDQDLSILMVDHLSPGYYILRIKGDGFQVLKKFVKEG